MIRICHAGPLIIQYITMLLMLTAVVVIAERNDSDVMVHRRSAFTLKRGRLLVIIVTILHLLFFVKSC